MPLGLHVLSISLTYSLREESCSFRLLWRQRRCQRQVSGVHGHPE